MAGRSANRGMCAQPCRLPYELIDENGRSLSCRSRARAVPARHQHIAACSPSV
ncbi:MAG: U32 family peptidase [Collinsella sp.]